MSWQKSLDFLLEIDPLSPGVRYFALANLLERATHTPAMEAAIESRLAFLLGTDPAAVEYPMGYTKKTNRSSLHFGYPGSYVTDVLQNMEVLSALGYGQDPRLANSLDLIAGKQDAQGRWKMEYSCNGKTLIDVEETTLRAPHVLKRAAG